MAVSEETLFSKEDLLKIDLAKTPKAIAIIPDGNRRWAFQNGLAVRKGHEQGAINMMRTVRAAKELGVKEIIFYVFSTENWSRKSSEIQTLFFLFNSYLEKKRKEMIEKGVRFFTIGDLSKLPKSLVENIEQTKVATVASDSIDVILAVNYGGRDEITRAIRTILDDYHDQKVKKEEISEELISRYMDTKGFSDPELMIRTSKEQRQSNFLLWQSFYSEWCFFPKLWPDFTPEDLFAIFLDFQNRDRRIGG